MNVDWISVGTFAQSALIVAGLMIVGVLTIIGAAILVIAGGQYYHERSQERLHYRVMACPYCNGVFHARMGANAADKLPDSVREYARGGLVEDAFRHGEYIRVPEKNEFGVEKAIGVRFFDAERAAERLLDERHQRERRDATQEHEFEAVLVKPHLLDVGVTYRNHRGTQARKILARGPEHADSWMQDKDVVKYVVTRGERKGEERVMSAASFASWAAAMEYAADSLTRFDQAPGRESGPG